MGAKKKSPGQNQDPQEFLDDPRVKACVASVETLFNKEDPKIISDVIDGDGHQYVHLVQKGGGTLGIALVGYTHILEKAGIRFLNMAGTSAGAINTGLLMVMGPKKQAKSEKVLKEICDLDFFALVDGHPFARKMIKYLITDKMFTSKIKKKAYGWGVAIALLLFANFVLFGLQNRYPGLAAGTALTLFVLCILGFSIIAIVFYAKTLIKRLKNSGFGINPGNYFYNWVKDIFNRHNVSTVSELIKLAGEPVQDLCLRDPRHPQGLVDLNGSVTFITSEITKKNKIQFPQMIGLFKPQAEIDSIHPAGFIRASMAIPVFFESYFINNIKTTDPDVRAAWLEYFEDTHPPTCARFVDGGILSNFPIDLFYTPSIIIPRLPVFGIDLDDSEEGDNTEDAESWSLMGYFGRMFSTIQNHSDKQFLLKNKVYGTGVGKVKVSGYNWLDFFMKPKEKVDLFAAGAQAACKFLHNFDWQKYKTDRAEI